MFKNTTYFVFIKKKLKFVLIVINMNVNYILMYVLNYIIFIYRTYICFRYFKILLNIIWKNLEENHAQ